MQVVLRIARYYRNYLAGLIIAAIALAIGAAVDLVTPSFIGIVVDCALKAAVGAVEVKGRTCPIEAEGSALVSLVFFIMLGLAFVRAAFQFLQGYFGEYGSQGIAYELRKQIYQHLQELSFSWHDRAQTGQLVSRATSDVEQLKNFTGRAFLQMGRFIITIVGISILLFAMNWHLAIAALVALPFLLRAGSWYGLTIQPMWRQAQQEVAVLASLVQENLAGGRVVRAFAQEPAQIANFEVQNIRLLDQLLRAARIQSWANPLLDALGNIGLVTVLWYGGYLIINNELTVGELVAFNGYLLLVVRPVRMMGNLIGQAARAVAAGERIFEILDAEVDVVDAPNAGPLPVIKGTVTFDHVWCSYLGGDPVLRDVSFEARPGQVIALLGATGSGKTTVVNLIPRFYDVSEGRVLIDGTDVRDVQLSSLRRQIGIVMQDTTLFTGTIRENISFGVPEATEERVVEMAKAARAHDFVMGFPGGYDTLVGERGVTLSGGQKQRIAIARALLLDPRILILDDFTSAVDTETEVLIREALDVLMLGRTTFVIAQRVSTVQSADFIIVLDHGVVAGTGNHEELLESNEIYAEIYQLQLVDASVAETLGEDAALALTSGSRTSGGNGHNGNERSTWPGGPGRGAGSGGGNGFGAGRRNT
ncbi:MAG: ABC transporter ATP-binding protein [Chloroflexi bacterium]|nr:ABC transporter ATP-binding protein [Chloroflexota bacterium]